MQSIDQRASKSSGGVASALRTDWFVVHASWLFVLVLRLHSVTELAKREDANSICFQVKDPRLV